jgi:flagellar protein FlgJ
MIQDITMLSHMNQTNPEKALEKVCSEFETLFAHQLLKSMAESMPEGLLEGGLADDIYKDMLYMEVARSVGESGALGIAEILKRHIQERFGEDGKSSLTKVNTDKMDKVDIK